MIIQGQSKSSCALISSELDEVAVFFSAQLDCPDDKLVPFVDYLKNSRGKMLRASMCLLCGRLCGGINKKHIKIAAVLEMIHAATLLHDDVIDDAAKRRGLDTANKLWGDNFAVLSGDYLLSRAFGAAIEIYDKCINAIFADMASTICRGEMLQNVFRGNFEMTAEQYLDTIEKKTAVFFAQACRLGAMICGSEEKNCDKLYNFGLNFGMAFQIADDIADCISSQSKTGKTGGRDISTQTLTLPVIYALKNLSAESRQDLLEQIAAVDVDREKIVKILKSAKAIEYAKSAAAGYRQKALDILADFNTDKSAEVKELKKLCVSL